MSSEEIATTFDINNELKTESCERKERIIDELSKFKKTRNYIKIKLNDINATYVGKYIETECRVVGESDKKALPEAYTVYCRNPACGGTARIDMDELPLDLYVDSSKDLSSLIFRKAKYELDLATKSNPNVKCNHKHSVIEEEEGYIDLKVVRLREVFDQNSEINRKKEQDFKGYIIGTEIESLKKVIIQAKVIVEHKGKGLVLVINHVESATDEMVELTHDDSKLLDKYFKYNKRLDEDIDGLINPRVFNRRLAKECVLLTVLSPLTLPGDGNRRGVIHTLFLGDTKCSKSEISRVGIVEQMGIGDWASIETGGRTGLLYTIDNDLKLLKWGVMPQNDGGYLTFDGLQRMHSEEMGEFREVLESGILKVRRSISGETPARVRITAAANPTRPMEQFLYRCDSVKKTNCFTDEPDITRWDLYAFFGDKDVDQKTIAEHPPLTTSIPLDLFKKKVYWVWSRTKDQIIYADNVEKIMAKNTVKLYEEFATSTLPMVHNGTKWTMQRIAIAIANKYNSMSDDFENIIVLPEHAEKAYDFLKWMYMDAELHLKKVRDLEKSDISEDDMEFIKENKYATGILKLTSDQYMSSEMIGEILDLSKDTIKNYAKTLVVGGFLYSSSRKGYRSTSKGIRVMRLLKNEGFDLTKKKYANYANQPISVIGKKDNVEVIDAKEGVSEKNTLITLFNHNPGKKNKKNLENENFSEQKKISVISGISVISKIEQEAIDAIQRKEDQLEDIDVQKKNTLMDKSVHFEGVLAYKNEGKNTLIEKNVQKIKRIAQGFRAMFYHPNYTNKDTLTMQEMLSYFGTTEYQIDFQCKQLATFDPKKFIYLDQKLTYIKS